MKNKGNQTNFYLEINSLLRDIIHNFWIVILAAIIGNMVIYISTHTVYKPEYISSSTLIVRVKSGTHNFYANLSAAINMTNIFTKVFVQPTVELMAAEHIEGGTFKGKIIASQLPNTNILTLSVVSSSPSLAYQQLRAVIEVYPNLSESIFANAVIDVMYPPEMPQFPSNNMTFSKKGLIIAAFAMAGLGLIGIISFMRDTIKDEKIYFNNIGTKLIGTVIHEKQYKTVFDFIKRKEKILLINNPLSSFRFTENFQKIATKLEYINRTNGDKIFLLTSVADHEGKSTISANLSIALASRGKRVLLMDMDFIRPNLQKVFDMKVPSNSDLAGFLSNRIKKDEYKLLRYRSSNLYMALNTYNHLNYIGWTGSSQIQNILEYYKGQFDFIIIDTPPMFMTAEVTSVMPFSDKVMLIIRTDRVYTSDINEAILSINEHENKFAGCILNDVYREFSFFGQNGTDETGDTNYTKYEKYNTANDI